MIRLTREVRFSVDRDWAGHVEFSRPITNSWGGWPSAVGIVPYLKLRATVVGVPDARTGYLVNIRILDDLLRQHAIPYTAEQLRAHGWRMPAERLLTDVWTHLRPRLPAHAPLVALELLATPTATFQIVLAAEPEGMQPSAGENAMLLMTQQFEFSAAHRLHCDSLSGPENVATFGKCNNPNGHGHNYVLEVTLANQDAQAGVVFPLPRFEQIVRESVIERLDHKHLNLDTPEFRTLNPSVENIAKVIWTLLADRFAPARLHRVRVYETAKTWADYSAS